MAKACGEERKAEEERGRAKNRCEATVAFGNKGFHEADAAVMFRWNRAQEGGEKGGEKETEE
jgi:hypothetical protein